VKVRSIPISWIIEDQHRLDCGPFTKGGIEARKLLEHAKFAKRPLVDLVQGGHTGLYHVGMDKLRWVDSPAHGVPLLRSADILKADLSNQPLIARRQVISNSLFTCPRGTTLITRSGTIGRMTYCRRDMEQMAMSQDVLKVVPDSSKVPPGFLFAFLSSRFGIPLVVNGTFGSIIVHIEGDNIADLPVPCLGKNLEVRVHDLIEEAAEARTKAISLLHGAQQDLFKTLQLPSPKDLASYRRPLVASVEAHELVERADAWYFSAPNLDARAAYDECSAEEHKRLRDVAEIFIPDIFKRKYAPDPQYGYPYITGGDVFEIAPNSEKFLMKRVAEENKLVLREGTILIQEAGQLGGLIGRAVLVGRHLAGFACSNNMVRVIANSDADIGYIYLVLSNEYGLRLISREAAGSSIPHLDQQRVAEVSVPWPKAHIRKRLGAPVREAVRLRDHACEVERQAREIVELAI